MTVNPNKTFYNTFKESPLNYLFNAEVTKIISYYKNNSIDKFNETIIKYNKLKKSFSTYALITELSLEAQLVELLRNNMTTVTDLQQQIIKLESSLETCMNKENTMYQKGLLTNTDKQLTQDTSIKLEYLQYLLMYDINATNGLFLPAQLDIAAANLKRNNGNLVYNNFIYTI